MRATFGVGTALLVALAFSSCSADGPVGDPHGAILAQLSRVRAAVPTGARISRSLAEEPVFTGSCYSTIPGVSFAVLFVSSEPVNQVESEVAGRLARAGWSRTTHDGPAKWYDEIDGKQELADNYIDRWTNRLGSGRTEGATLQVGVPLNSAPGASLTWQLGANASSVGGPVMRCGQAQGLRD